eukprot:748874-Hanusia_phi.AAC.2
MMMMNDDDDDDDECAVVIVVIVVDDDVDEDEEEKEEYTVVVVVVIAAAAAAAAAAVDDDMKKNKMMKMMFGEKSTARKERLQVRESAGSFKATVLKSNSSPGDPQVSSTEQYQQTSTRSCLLVMVDENADDAVDRKFSIGRTSGMAGRAKKTI